MTSTARRYRQISKAEEARIQKGIAQDPDNPEWTEDDFKKAKSFREALPDLAAAIDKAKRGRPPVANPKQQVSLRLSPDVLEAFKATGKGWQSRIDDALRKAAGLN